jgi:tyrosinase
MGVNTSPNDPVFFLHHCYLDLLWERWKRQHPTLSPYLPQSGWPNLDMDARLVFHAADKTAPWTDTWSVRDVLSTEALDYTYGQLSALAPNCPVIPPPAGPTVEVLADDLTI